VQESEQRPHGVLDRQLVERERNALGIDVEHGAGREQLAERFENAAWDVVVELLAENLAETLQVGGEGGRLARIAVKVLVQPEIAEELVDQLVVAPLGQAVDPFEEVGGGDLLAVEDLRNGQLRE
jgi:hypothetical protein